MQQMPQTWTAMTVYRLNLINQYRCEEDVTEVIVEEDVTQKDVTKIKANKIYFCNQELTASCAKSR